MNGSRVTNGSCGIARGASVVTIVGGHRRIYDKYTRSIADFSCRNTEVRRQTLAVKAPAYF